MRVALFDLDGTLIDSARLYAECYWRAFVADPTNYLADRAQALLTDPSIKELHFVGSWAGSEWGTSGSADWNLIAELDGGNFVHLKTSGGWQ